MKTGNPSDFAITITGQQLAKKFRGAQYISFQVFNRGVFAPAMVADNLAEIFGPAAILNDWNFDTNAGEFIALPGAGLRIVVGEKFFPAPHS